MADPTFKRVAFRYRQYDRQWWEIHTTSDVSYSVIAGKLEPIIQASLAFRHPSVYVPFVRVSNPFVQREAEIIRLNLVRPALGATIPSPTSTACIWQLKGDNVGVKRNVWLRGLKEADVRRYANTGQDYMAGDLPNQVAAYVEQLRTSNYGIPSVVPRDNAANRRWPITSITVLPLQQVKLNFQGAPTFNDSSRVILYRIPQKLFPGLAGRFTVSADATGFIPQGYLTPMAEGNYPMVGAAFRNETWRFSAYLSGGASFLAFDRRDTQGGPLAGRGRSRAKIKRSL